MAAIMVTSWVFRLYVRASLTHYLCRMHSAKTVCQDTSSENLHCCRRIHSVYSQNAICVFAECILRRQRVRTHHLKTYIAIIITTIVQNPWLLSQNTFRVFAECILCIRRMQCVGTHSANTVCQCSDCNVLQCDAYTELVFAECILRIQCASVMVATWCNVLLCDARIECAHLITTHEEYVTHLHVSSWRIATSHCNTQFDRRNPPPRGGFFVEWFPDQEPCVRDVTTRCDGRISSWHLLHMALDQGT